jgi:hypothetical protein
MSGMRDQSGMLIMFLMIIVVYFGALLVIAVKNRIREWRNRRKINKGK